VSIMSCRRSHTLAVTLAAAATLAGCAAGAPPGFSGGSSWALPLVGPLENGVLITPVTIAGHGPYLFVLDPDAASTSIDEDLVRELDLYTGNGPRLIDESDTSRPSRVAELPAVTLGTLTVRGLTVTVHPVGTYYNEGRPIRGVVGRDVIADSLVFGFDRDAGMAYLAAHDAFTPPPSAVRLGYRIEDANDTPGIAVPRRVTAVEINGSPATLHLDLGAVPSQLRPQRWSAARLAPVPYQITLVDEVGGQRTIDKAGIANHVVAGGASSMGVTMVPFADRRWEEQDIDGSLGLNFFAGYVVWADWHERRFYLVARDGEQDRTQQRLDRWRLPGREACRIDGCATARLDRIPSMPAPSTPAMAPDHPAAPPPATVMVERDPALEDLALEVLLEAVDASGEPLGLPRLVANFAPGTAAIHQRVAPAFANARFRVLDMSPFARACPTADGCVFEVPANR